MRKVNDVGDRVARVRRYCLPSGPLIEATLGRPIDVAVIAIESTTDVLEVNVSTRT